jgi:hypothetical protein
VGLGCNIFEGPVEVGQLVVDNRRHTLDYDGHIGMMVEFVSLMHPKDSRNHDRI